MREDQHEAFGSALKQRVRDWTRNRGSEEFTATHVADLLKIKITHAQSILRWLAKEKLVTYNIKENTNTYIYKASLPSIQSVPWVKTQNDIPLGRYYP